MESSNTDKVAIGAIHWPSVRTACEMPIDSTHNIRLDRRTDGCGYAPTSLDKACAEGEASLIIITMQAETVMVKIFQTHSDSIDVLVQ
jgi:hypothetical protein